MDISKLILSNHPTTCSLDPIPTHLLQAISSSVIPSLTHIINTSLHSGTIPTAFKQARVSPLLKKPSLNLAILEIYRPVSLLPFIAKTLERVVFNQLSMFLVQNNLLDSNQFGFKSGHSTETALLSVTEALRLARAASKSSVLILLDLSAAFDTVNHQILLSTLRKMGISRTALQWFKSYLSGRSFRVSWRGEVSKSQLLATGFPQGLVLGPLLFSIYMMSTGSVIQKHGFSYHCYADDTQLYFSFQPDDLTVAARIAACLRDISSWMKDHHLQLNLTELLVVPASPSFHHNYSIQLGSSTITPFRTARNLGLVIVHQLRFTDHIATRSCRFALYNIRKIRLDYCNALFAGLPACSIKPLQLIPNAAARVIFNESKKSSCYSSPHQVTLSTSSPSHQIQGTDACLQDDHLRGTNINSLVQTYVPSRSLRSASEWRLLVPYQRG
uniref:Reverse transcriptase domain-containing protein n=1 Tax=Cyprinus carpio TaxID=7962 RepID=A0A8C1N9P6_CYPCA